MAALCAPRKLYIQIGKKDPVFDYHGALEEAERVRPYYEHLIKWKIFKFPVEKEDIRFLMMIRGMNFFFVNLV